MPTRTPVPKKTAKKGSARKRQEQALIEKLAEVQEASATASERTLLGHGHINWTFRMRAMAKYVLNPDGITIEALARDPEFAGKVSAGALKRWAQLDGWIEARNDAMRETQAKLRKAVTKRLSQDTYRRVQTYLHLRQKALDRVATTEPKSLEGLIGAIVTLEEKLANIAKQARDGIVDDFGRPVEGAGGSVEGTRLMTHDFDPKALREMARKLNAKPRYALRASIAAANKLRAQRELKNQAGPEE